MATITVTTLDGGAKIDTQITADSDEVFNISTAVALANSRPGADEIVFAEGLSGLIRLTAGEMAITDELIIDGGGVITISGDKNGDDDLAGGYITDVGRNANTDDNSRILSIEFDAGTVIIDGLTLTGGVTREDNAGGGAIAGGGDPLIIRDSLIAGNKTLGFEARGGAIASSGDITLENSMISGNQTDGRQSKGGGIFSSRRLEIVNSTISDNRTNGDSASAGGAYAFDISATNATISGNVTEGVNSRGGGIYAFGSVTLDQSTVTGNSTADDSADGGGVLAFRTIEVSNSIVLQNSAGSGEGNELLESSLVYGSDVDGLISFSGTNIVGRDSAAFDTSGHTGGGVAINADPALVFASLDDSNVSEAGLLRDNGGPIATVALRFADDNPAIDASTGVNVQGQDARGVSAFDIVGVGASSGAGLRDVGAVEIGETPGLVVTTLSDDSDGGDGLISLREAVAYANDREGADTITFAPSLQGIVRLTQGQIEWKDDLTIDGDARITISGDAAANDFKRYGATDVFSSFAFGALNDNSRLFFVDDSNDSPSNVTLKGLTLTGGFVVPDGQFGGSSVNGGAIFVNDHTDLTLIDSTVIGNAVRSDSTLATGGGISSRGDVTLIDTVIHGNIALGASARGGGVSTSADLTLVGSVLTRNGTRAEYGSYGGGGHARGNTAVQNSTITNNSAFSYSMVGQGGGISVSGGGSISNSIILGNVINNSLGDEIHDRGRDPLQFFGKNIVGVEGSVDLADLGAGSPAGSLQHGDPTQIFAATVNNNGVRAGVLADNGGDRPSVALKADAANPALDAVTVTGVDGRGAPRGVDQFMIDNGGTSDIGAFELQTQVLVAPTITSGAAFTAAENQTVVGAVMASDDKAGVTFAITGGVDAALFSINATTGALRFNAAPNFEAPGDANGDNIHQIVVTITDSDGLTASQSATVTLTDANEAPVAAASSASGDEDTVISGVLNASDVDGDALSFAVVSGPSNGSVTVNANGSFQFTPVADFNGTDSFTFRASDGVLSDTATATIMVIPVDEPVDPVDPVGPVDPVNPPVPVDPPDPVDPPAPVGPTNGDDILLGTALNDTINALAGNDNVNGLAGDDLLIGAGGDDSIKGASGDDRLRGSRGEDTLKGGGGDDNIKGNGGDDVIRGNGGDDAIRAGGGADNVKGGGGSDVIFGGGGADRLNGGGGADTIRGNGGDDTLKGNGGADVFQFRSNDRNDTIQDFRQGQDKIQIQNGANSFEALRIEQDGRDVLIGFGLGQVRVITDNAAAFDEDDFIF